MMMDVLVYSLMVMILNALLVVAQRVVLFYVYYDTDFFKKMELLVRLKY